MLKIIRIVLAKVDLNQAASSRKKLPEGVQNERFYRDKGAGTRKVFLVKKAGCFAKSKMAGAHQGIPGWLV